MEINGCQTQPLRIADTLRGRENIGFCQAQAAGKEVQGEASSAKGIISQAKREFEPTAAFGCGFLDNRKVFEAVDMDERNPSPHDGPDFVL
jgi:hypothetical protein